MIAAIKSRHAEQFRAWLALRMAPLTLKQRISLIAGCWEWAVQKEWIAENPWREQHQAIRVPPKQKPRPFSVTEVRAIIDAFEGDRYYRHYTDFVRFLFGTGCRIGEAIALRWEHLSEDCVSVWLGEAYTRGDLRATKTYESREFELTEGLQQMLLERRPKQWDTKDLVFPSPKKRYIDDHNFRNRAWKKILTAAQVSYRKPYNTRHTFVSHCIAAGMGPAEIAEITGHDVEILIKHYLGSVQGKLRTPSLY